MGSLYSRHLLASGSRPDPENNRVIWEMVFYNEQSNGIERIQRIEPFFFEKDPQVVEEEQPVDVDTENLETEEIETEEVVEEETEQEETEEEEKENEDS